MAIKISTIAIALMLYFGSLQDINAKPIASPTQQSVVVTQKPSREEVQATVYAVVCEQMGLEADAVNDSTNYQKDLNIDSMEMLEIMMAIEGQFGVRIADDKIAKMKTIGQTIDIVYKLLTEQEDD